MKTPQEHERRAAVQYRPFGPVDFQASALGFGCMRLPTLKGDPANIDEPLAIDMIRYAIDHGVNYVDTAYMYHRGNSEPLLAKALADGYREKVKVATKLPLGRVESRDDFDRLLDEQRAKLNVETIDFYLMHNLDSKQWKRLGPLGLLPWLDQVRESDRVTHVGFSFHDDLDAFKKVVDGYDWEFCQIQYNLMNEQVQAGTEGLCYAADQGLAVVIMEPLLGGTLASPPEAVQAVYDDAPGDLSPAARALLWLWDKPQVACVLSGMSTMDQVVENVATAEASGVGCLGAQGRGVLAHAQQAYQDLRPVPCTFCGYCMPCPQGVDIPKNMRLYIDALVYGPNRLRGSRNQYRKLPEEQQAASCVACQECEEECPQHIPIAETMEQIHATLGEEE
jgi:hypothetical protein